MWADITGRWLEWFEYLFLNPNILCLKEKNKFTPPFLVLHFMQFQIEKELAQSHLKSTHLANCFELFKQLLKLKFSNNI